MLPELASHPDDEDAVRPEAEREVPLERSASRVSSPPLVARGPTPPAIRVRSSPPVRGVEQCGHTSASASTAAAHDGQETTVDTAGF
jgi:hypothetical protein